MSKLLIALGAFIGTISIVWILTSRDGNQALTSSLPQAQQADVYLQSDGLLKKMSPTPTPTPTPTLLVPQTLLTPSATPKPTLSVGSPTPTPSDVETPTPTPTPTPILTPTPTITINPSVLTIETFTSADKFARGSTYTITIKSSPNASCFIEIYLPETGSQSKSAGIWDSANNKPVTNTTDSTGTTSFAWKVGSATKLGFATIKATCTLGDQLATGQFQIEIIAAS